MKIYARFSTTDLRNLLPWKRINEEYRSDEVRYVVGEILLSDLITHRDILAAKDVFLCNIPYLFADRDDTASA